MKLLWKYFNSLLVFYFLEDLVQASNIVPVGLRENNVLTLAHKIARTDMSQCSLILLHDSQFLQTKEILSFEKIDSPGVVLIDINQISSTELLRIKESLLKTNNPKCIAFIVTINTSWNNKLLVDIFSGHYRILVVGINPKLHYDEILTTDGFFNNSDEVVLIRKEDLSEKWAIYTLRKYQAQALSSLRFEQRVDLENQLENSTYFPGHAHTNFHGYPFVVAALPYSFFVWKNDPSTSSQDRWGGYEVDLLNLIANGANFTYSIAEPADRTWGQQLPNGGWSGLIGMVVNETAHWAISDISDRPIRREVVGFAHPILFTAVQLITPIAQPVPAWLAPLLPFQEAVWACIIISLVLSSLILNLISRFTGSEEDTYFRSFYNCFNYCLCPLFLFGTYKEYYNGFGRIFLVFWLFKAMLVSIFYSSSLTAFLILPGYTEPINSFEELIESDLIWGMQNYGGFIIELFETTEDPVLKEVGEKIHWGLTMDDFLEGVAKGTHATWDILVVVKLKAAVQYTDKSGKVLLHFAEADLTKDRVAWPILENAIFKDRIDELLLRLEESGITSKLLQNAMDHEADIMKTQADKYEQTTPSSFIALNLAHFQGAFYVLFCGQVLGMTFLMLEICIAKKEMSK